MKSFEGRLCFRGRANETGMETRDCGDRDVGVRVPTSLGIMSSSNALQVSQD